MSSDNPIEISGNSNHNNNDNNDNNDEIENAFIDNDNDVIPPSTNVNVDITETVSDGSSTTDHVLQISTPSPASSREPSSSLSSRSRNNDDDTTVSSNHTPNEMTSLISRKELDKDSDDEFDWFAQREYIMFKNELTSQRKINNFILKECKENKRLLDLKYNDLTTTVNNIQTSVIFVSTLSGFLQATKVQFGIPVQIIEVVSITISTYISLILSISKYYKLDELKEQIQNLREKYSLLHNKIEHRMDVLGPWNNRHLWEYNSATERLAEWREVLRDMNEQYRNIIETKQSLTTEFEIIMDTISRNKYNYINANRNYNNRMELFTTQKMEADLESKIVAEQKKHTKNFRPSILLQHEALDNWDEDESVV